MTPRIATSLKLRSVKQKSLKGRSCLITWDVSHLAHCSHSSGVAAKQVSLKLEGHKVRNSDISKKNLSPLSGPALQYPRPCHFGGVLEASLAWWGSVPGGVR